MDDLNDVVEPQAPKPDASSELARQQGWKPLEEWEAEGKSPEDWVDAKEFNRRGEYMDRIKTQSSLIKKLEKKLASHESTLKELAEHHQKVSQIEYEKALKDLKGLKKEALELGDHAKVVEIDDQIQDLKSMPKESPKAAQPQEMHPDVVEWMEENPWYEDDPILNAATNGLVADMIKKNPELQGQAREVLDKVTAKLMEEFPNKFGKKARSTMVTEPSSSGTGTATPSKPKYTARHLTPEQKQVAKKFIDAGAIKNMDEYAQQLAEIGGIEK